jgi:hypothetical protein
MVNIGVAVDLEQIEVMLEPILQDDVRFTLVARERRLHTRLVADDDLEIRE